MYGSVSISVYQASFLAYKVEDNKNWEDFSFKMSYLLGCPIY